VADVWVHDAYVYLACWLILSLCAVLLEALTDIAGRHNFLWSRDIIARQRGISAYRAWLPFERIRPAHIPQRDWEEQFAWPPNNQPPYLPLRQRMLRGTLLYAAAIAIMLAALEIFTPFPILSWLASTLGRLSGLKPA
jgi:hypothetical protein